MGLMYRFIWSLCWIVYHLLLREKVEGIEHVPRTGSYILAGNHISNLDPPLVATSMWRQLTFMAKEELFQNRWVGRFITSIRAYPVKRGAPDRNALRKTFDYLESGMPVVIFPEGTRSEDGELKPPEMGVGMIACRSGVPVIPFYLWGTDRAMPKGGKFRLARVGIRYGPPLHFGAKEGQKLGREDYERAAAEIMAAVARLRDQGRPEER